MFAAILICPVEPYLTESRLLQKTNYSQLGSLRTERDSASLESSLH